jgi:hypothetical protein
VDMSIASRLKYATLVLFASSLLICTTADATVLYTNGDFPNNATVQGWNVTHGNVAASTFDLASSSTLTGADIGLWAFPQGDALNSIDWSIASLPDGTGTTYASGTATITNSIDFGLNSHGYDLLLDTFALPNVNLASGTYWLILQNGSVSGGDNIFWDQGGGASSSWISAGYLDPATNCGFSFNTNGSCGLSFDITGTANVPEPISLSVFGVGLAGAVALRRRRQKSA